MIRALRAPYDLCVLRKSMTGIFLEMAGWGLIFRATEPFALGIPQLVTSEVSF